MKLKITTWLCVFAINVFADQPNIIYILADDMGVGDVSALNPEAKLKTPQDGTAQVRGFLGDYEITVTSPAGRKNKILFTLEKGAAAAKVQL